MERNVVRPKDTTSSLTVRCDSLLKGYEEYFEVRKERDDSEAYSFGGLTYSDFNDGYRVIASILIEAVGVYLYDSDDLAYETIRENVLGKSSEREAAISILKDFRLFLEAYTIPEVADRVVSDLNDRERFAPER